MSRHLLLVRHAKSAWNDASITDHDRPLSPRGVRALPRLCDHLLDGDHRPDVVLCSSSRRTVATLDGIRPALALDALVQVDPALYLASAATLLARLRGIDDVRRAMVIGHNPGIHDLTMLLAGTGTSGIGTQLRAKFPTGAAVTLSFDGAWADLSAGAVTIDDLFTPRATRS